MDNIEVLMFVIGLFVTVVAALASYAVGQIDEVPKETKSEIRDKS